VSQGLATKLVALMRKHIRIEMKVTQTGPTGGGGISSCCAVLPLKPELMDAGSPDALQRTIGSTWLSTSDEGDAFRGILAADAAPFRRGGSDVRELQPTGSVPVRNMRFAVGHQLTCLSRAAPVGREIPEVVLPSAIHTCRGSLSIVQTLRQRLRQHLGSTLDILRCVAFEIFPFNRYTQRRPAHRGPTLSIKGLLRAIVTNYADLRFFAARVAGGQRRYRVCIAIDCSTSMQGYSFHDAVMNAYLLTTVMAELNIAVSIIRYGTDVGVVKLSEQPFDDHTVAALFSLECDAHGSHDADALHVAMELTKGVQARSIFMLTDGSSSSMAQLRFAQQAAEAEMVDVVAIASGPLDNAVQQTYGRYVSTLSPLDLPAALLQLYTEDRDVDPLAEWRRKRDAEIADANYARLLQDLTSRVIKDARLLEVATTGMCGVDVAFVVDTTASMFPYMRVVQSYMKTLAGALQGHEALKSFGFRFALIAFRDYDDAGYPKVLSPFVPCGEFAAAMERPLDVGGGGDMAEDVAGALEFTAKYFSEPTAGQPNSPLSNPRFVVLIHDAPQHGFASSGDVTDRCAQAGCAPAGCASIESAMQRLSENHIFLIASSVRPDRTMTTHQEMYRRYPATPHSALKRCLTEQSIFDGSVTRRTQHTHYVLCVDTSGSMRTPCSWTNLRTGAREDTQRIEVVKSVLDYFKQKRLSYACQETEHGDLYTTIIFHSCASRVQPPEGDRRVGVHINEAASFSLPNETGATAFDPPLLKAADSFTNTPAGLRQSLIFLTDGRGSYTQQAVQKLCNSLRNGAHQCYFISGFEASGDEVIRKLSRAVPQSKCYIASDADKVVGAFEEIVEAHKPIAELAQTVGDAVISEVTKTVAEQF